MKNPLRHLLALLALPTALLATESARNCGCDCCKGKESCCCRSDQAADPAKRHPLKGVVVDLHPAKHSLMVKHEAIPGYMMAMTMMFRVDDATLQAVKPGDAITATLVEEEDGFRLENVRTVRP